MKISREVRVGLLAALCLFLLYFGFRFLKGTNIFNPIHSYTGRYTDMRGLVEQAPVYVRGYKVGQVESIVYDFGKDTAFTVTVSVNRDIRVVEGSRLLLVPDGLLGGMAIELVVPSGALAEVPARSELPTGVRASLIENIETTLLSSIDSVMCSVRELVENVNTQLSDNRLEHILANVDELSVSLKGSAKKLDGVLSSDVPEIVEQVDSILTDVRVLAANVSDADVAQLVARADSTIGALETLVAQLNTTEGTVGLLLHDDALYHNLNSAIQMADSLMTTIEAQPNSLIWGKKKKK